MKETVFQKLMPRKPLQKRALQKVELILEAAMRLLDKGGLAALTTNAVAEMAGVSIGTLYQYFANKEAILGALADREMAAMSERILVAIRESAETSQRDRIARIMRAVVSSYGGRRQVHRLVMQHSLEQGGGRLAPLIEQLVALLTQQGRPAGDGRSIPVSPVDAFVLTNAFVGVMRAMIMRPDPPTPTQDEIEEAMARLIVSFTGQSVSPKDDLLISPSKARNDVIP